MGQIENSPRHEALPSTRDIFPLRMVPINKAVLTVRDTNDPNNFVFQERAHAGQPFYTYLERYYTKFASAQKDTDNPGVDKQSFFLGAMLTHQMIREQVSQLNSDLKDGLKRVLSDDETIELPRFEDHERLFNEEMKSLSYWRAESGHLDSDFATAASTRIFQLADPESNENGDLDSNIAHVLFYVSALASDPSSFYTGAGATYFAIKNAIAENQQFEELFKQPSKAA